MWTCFGTQHLSLVERLSSFRGYSVQSLYTTGINLVCPLFRGLSSFGVSFIGGFIVYVCFSICLMHIMVMRMGVNLGLRYKIVTICA